MSGGIEIQVTLPMNRFHGEEWPCSPARLFRALLAGSMTGAYRENFGAVEPALRWLESQKPPEIEVCRSKVGEKYRISVPNNDSDIPKDPAILRTMKSVEPRILQDETPHLVYRWREALPDELTVAALRMAVNTLHTLGWGIDMAFADLKAPASEGGGQKWVPSEKGDRLQVPVEGSLDDLRHTYERFLNSARGAGIDADARASVYKLQPYSTDEGGLGHIEFAMNGVDDPISQSYPPEKAMAISAWVRHAAAAALREESYPEDEVNALALGHDEGVKNPDRLLYIPLCPLGARYSDGRIRRVMIAVRNRPPVLKTLTTRLHGRTLTDFSGAEVCRLSFTRDSTVTSEYTRAAQEWASVTPVILHGHNALRGTISLPKTERLLSQAFEQAGYRAPDIAEWAFQPAPFWNKTPGARAAVVPRHLSRWPRYHICVRFRGEVQGPVVAGIGRHYGFGVFAARKR